MLAVIKRSTIEVNVKGTTSNCKLVLQRLKINKIEGKYENNQIVRNKCIQNYEI